MLELVEPAFQMPQFILGFLVFFGGLDHGDYFVIRGGFLFRFACMIESVRESLDCIAHEFLYFKSQFVNVV